MAGLILGLRDQGVDLARADRFIGTSAGAVVGAVLTGGGDLERLTLPRPADAPSFPVDPSRFQEILTMLASPGLDQDEVYRRVGKRALEMSVGDPAAYVARINELLTADEWPDRELVITSIDVATGKPKLWTRMDKAGLAEAVAASGAVPGVFPPIPIEGSYYIDGGMRSTINADLAVGAEVIVVMEPLAHVFPRTASDTELGGATTLFIVPDTEAIAAFGPNLFDSAALAPAYRAGVRQAEQAAAQLRQVWPVCSRQA
jgi:NTE family protein